MKKLLFIAIVALFAVSVNAQVQFGLKAGVNLANIGAKAEGESVDGFKMKLGFHAGVIADISLSESFSVQPGLFFSQKGTKQEETISSGTETATTKLNYLDIPINAVYKIDAGSAKIHLFAGPVISYALSGKTTYEAAGESNDEDVDFGSNDGQIKKLDFGINFGAGVQINKILVTANYNLGLSNLVNGGDSDNFMKNRVIGISVGFLFGGK